MTEQTHEIHMIIHFGGGKPGLAKGENGNLQLIPAKKPLCCEDSDSSFFFSQNPQNKLSKPFICYGYGVNFTKGLWSLHSTKWAEILKAHYWNQTKEELKMPFWL